MTFLEKLLIIKTTLGINSIMDKNLLRKRRNISIEMGIIYLFSIVLYGMTDGKRHYFVTQSDGVTTAKSPVGMFPPEIDNDLKAVDTAIRNYYGMAKIGTPVKKTTEKENAEVKTVKTIPNNK